MDGKLTMVVIVPEDKIAELIGQWEAFAGHIENGPYTNEDDIPGKLESAILEIPRSVKSNGLEIVRL